MKLDSLLTTVKDKDLFTRIQNYIDFCRNYLEFIQTNLQAVIVARNENH